MYLRGHRYCRLFCFSLLKQNKTKTVCKPGNPRGGFHSIKGTAHQQRYNPMDSSEQSSCRIAAAFHRTAECAAGHFWHGRYGHGCKGCVHRDLSYMHYALCNHNNHLTIIKLYVRLCCTSIQVQERTVCRKPRHSKGYWCYQKLAERWQKNSI